MYDGFSIHTAIQITARLMKRKHEFLKKKTATIFQLRFLRTHRVELSDFKIQLVS